LAVGRLSELLLDLVDELEVQLEQASHEADRQQQVLLAVGEQACRALGVLQARLDVGDVVAQRADARARDLLADEVADQQPEQGVALERCEADWRPRVFA
jgi:hypothetical protein